MSIGKVVNLVKGNKKESIIVGIVVVFIVIITSSTLINNNFVYQIKSNELLELGSTSYQSDNVFVKNRTLDDMDTLIVTTESNLNEELESFLNECTELEVECIVNDDLVLDIKNSKSVLQTKVDEVNKKALDLKLDTSEVLNNQELNYVNKVSEINKMIDTESKRLDEAEKAEEEKKAAELAKQQEQELATAVTNTESTNNSSSDTSTSGGSTNTSNTSSNTSDTTSNTPITSSTTSATATSCSGKPCTYEGSNFYANGSCPSGDLTTIYTYNFVTDTCYSKVYNAPWYCYATEDEAWAAGENFFSSSNPTDWEIEVGGVAGFSVMRDNNSCIYPVFYNDDKSSAYFENGDIVQNW